MTIWLRITIWISVFEPTEGADTYERARVQASLSEEDCYRDLAEWLEIEFESKEQVEAAMNEAMDPATATEGYGVKWWKVEAQEVTG